MKNCYAKVFIGSDGKVLGVYAIEGASSAPSATGITFPDAGAFKKGTRTWGENKAGVEKGGTIIGCAPTIAHSTT